MIPCTLSQYRRQSQKLFISQSAADRHIINKVQSVSWVHSLDCNYYWDIFDSNSIQTNVNQMLSLLPIYLLLVVFII